ncbi:uncharacterized protein F5891DRAFT_1207693 [Suillus fuscotomentosus]|uniref:Uncharacterized protein n=1 Tax=Suillus fuscotomentosus TaxID=1912939 RepID=A0AAD4DT83_9AGAM|nr:uncharacterized protein F5891DRAFT_1207693 [Suillus fuscotomentosus]KAG1893317.1 hypothetical protein F5891DRAFT_1207693 [Suillus fuscotomentosus]
MWLNSVRDFILNYSCQLSTPIIAAIGWCQTWVIASIFLSMGKSNEVVEAIEEPRLQSSFVRYYNEAREDPGHSETSTCNYVAEQRYTGSLAKCTVLAAWPGLADRSTATPKKAVGVMSMDPGLSTQLFDLYHSVCNAGYLAYLSFLIQITGSLYGIVTVSIIWADDARLREEAYGVQLAATTCRTHYQPRDVFPWAPLHALYVTMAIAVALEFLFAVRGFLIGWHMSVLPGILRFFVVFSWLLPSAEALTLIFGLIAMKMEVSFISAKVIIFGLPALWLMIGPLLIIGALLGSHFGMLNCLVVNSSLLNSTSSSLHSVVFLFHL